MDNPFDGLITKIKEDGQQAGDITNEQRRQKRDAIYNTFSPMVNAVLDMLIAACHPGEWARGSDMSHLYCCHITWYAGPRETRSAGYDEHHDLRRVLEITLEQDDQCNPTAFKLTHHARVNRSLRTGLTRDELVRGIQEILA